MYPGLRRCAGLMIDEDGHYIYFDDDENEMKFDERSTTTDARSIATNDRQL